MRREWLALAAVVGVASALAACGSQRAARAGATGPGGATAGAATQAPETRHDTYGYVPPDSTAPRPRTTSPMSGDREQVATSLEERLDAAARTIASMGGEAAGDVAEERRVRYHARQLESLRSQVQQLREESADLFAEHADALAFRIAGFEESLERERQAR